MENFTEGGGGGNFFPPSTVMATVDYTDDWKFEDPIQRRIVGALLIFIGIAGLIGNAIVIVAFMFSERLQNITNVFVINLAVSDFLSSLLAPFFVQNVLTDNEDLLPKPLCAMVGILTYVFVSTSIVNHAVIAVNRYCSITRPVPVYRKLFSPLRIAIILVLMWTYSSIIPLSTHLSKFIAFGYNSKYRICSLDVKDERALAVASVRAVVIDVVCLIVLVIFYFKIFLFIKKHSNELLHLYSTERKVSDSSSIQRYDHDSKHSRKASTMTRIVNVEDEVGGVETVLKKPKPIWRQMARSVSESAITMHGVSNGSFSKESEDEDEMVVSASKTVDENEIEAVCDVGESSDGSESTGRKITSSNLSAIAENSELGNVSREAENKDGGEDDGEDDGEDADVDSSSSNVDENGTKPPSTDSPVRDHSEMGSSNGIYRKERYSSSASPSHNPNTINRRRISELVHRSFFGRSSSVSSTSERIRCMQVRLNRRQIQITKNLFVVVCAFLVCVSQYVVFLVVPSLERALPYSAVLLTFSHAVNPLIYAIKHPTFKVVIRPMITCKLSKIPGPSKLLKAILRK